LNSLALNIVFVTPTFPGNPFWDRVTAVAVACADNLDVNLSIVYGKDNRIQQFNAVKNITQSQTKPDYVIFSPYEGTATGAFSLLDNAEIPFVTLEKTLSESDVRQIGSPGQKYGYWLGEIFHNNKHAGKLLADELINQLKVRDKPKNTTINSVGIAGSQSEESSDRVLGLKASIRNINLPHKLYIRDANWKRDESKKALFEVAEDAGEIDIVWTASDEMALGAIDIINSDYKKMDNKTLVGGFDWTRQGLKSISHGELNASVGGHFMMAAWSIIKIYDHHHGKEAFPRDISEKAYHLALITADNIQEYLPLASTVDWSKLDYKKFSLTHNENLNQYNFNFKRVMVDLVK
jgi:ABC-type sugar transport system substrate-binding protein